jgi:alpha-beta hydrolase superfamily lysophospholipase
MKNTEKLSGIKEYIFTADSSPEAVILLVHGLGEYAGRYTEWARRFTDTGIEMRLFDLPGHGLSEGKRGVVPCFEEIYDILDGILAKISEEKPEIPLFLYGHSLGGGLVLDYLIRHRPSVSGAIITSPWIKLTSAPPGFKVAMVKALKNVFPDLTSSSGLNPAYLSHDPAVCREYVDDPLVHDRISLRLFSEAVKASDNIIKNASEIDVPLLLIHGRDDMITSPSGTMEVASSAPSALLKLWDDCFHELHNEPIKEDHFTFIKEWIETII